MHTCPACFRSFVRQGRLSNHLQNEHPSYTVPQVDVPDTEDLDQPFHMGLTFSSDEEPEEIPLDPFGIQDSIIGGDDFPLNPTLFELPEGRPFFEDSSDHQLQQGGLNDPFRDIVTQFIPRSEEY